MKKQLAKLALTAAFGLALAFTISCGNHSFEEFEEWLYGSSSSEEESYSSSSFKLSSSSSLTERVNSSSSVASGGSSSSSVDDGDSSSSSVASSGSSSSSVDDGESSSSSVAIGSSSSSSGPSDNKTYKTTKIGDQVWMAENLNIEIGNSVCYNNDPANCQKYGRLYDWETAMIACPSGWNLPSNAEWEKLLRYVDGTSGTESPYKSETAGKNLKTNGTNNYGFSALLGGYRSNGSFSRLGSIGDWWTSTATNSSNAYRRFMSSSADFVDYSSDNKSSYLFSVRCIKDGSCGSQGFNTSTQFCDNNTVYDLCGGKTYEPASQRCSPGDVVETKCGADWYDATNVNKRCENGVLEMKCGTEWYSYGPKMQFCSNGTTIKSYGKLTDTRDNKTYKTVEIGIQIWMAENLNYAANNSVCYDNKESYCNIYGRLYNWTTAVTACPSGWHLPSDAEWDVLVNYAGGSLTAGGKLKAANGWNKNGNGTDEFGFYSLPGGYGDSDGSLRDIGYYGYWWSTTELNANYAYIRYTGYYYEHVFRDNDVKYGLLSVRCIQD